MLVTQFMGCARTENFKHFRIYLEKSPLLLNPRGSVNEREIFELKQNRFVVRNLPHSWPYQQTSESPMILVLRIVIIDLVHVKEFESILLSGKL